MGRVWLARDEVLDRDVAIKEVVYPEDMSVEERTELFQRTIREARAAGRLSHPNVVAVYDVLQHQGRPWIVMELIRSRSLYQVIKEDGPITPRRAAEIGLAVLAALRTAHQAGVYHRDVKPGNVLLGNDGRVVLTDFGLATFEGDGTVTRSGVILGSAQYIAPERARDGVSGPESDLWSLGATLYAAVEGRAPFARDTPMATLTALATQSSPDPTRRAGPLRQVLIGLLRKNPRQRMKAHEVEKLLTRVAGGDSRGRRAAGRPVEPPVPAPPSTAPASIHAPIDMPRSRAAAATTPAPVPTPGTPARSRRAIALWVAGIAAVALAVAVPVGLHLRAGPGNPAAVPTANPAPTSPALTEAMGVQACAEQTADHETTVRAATGLSSALENWTPYVDRSGFGLNVPVGWGESRIGSLLCFRDRNSLKTIAVYDFGRRAGDPVRLVDDTAAWQAAASLDDYHRVGVQDMHLPEGGAMLEYAYQRGDTTMHGQNWMMRMGGRVFTVSVLASDSTWSVDRDFLVPACASFHVVTPE
jgi:eukaryotic-like serine/threonine-protein kinase